MASGGGGGVRIEEELKWAEPEGGRTENLCVSFGLLWEKLCVPFGPFGLRLRLKGQRRQHARAATAGCSLSFRPPRLTTAEEETAP